jgi:hypothetical protein
MEQFAANLRGCGAVSLADWQRRSAGERVLAALGAVLERQE